MKKILAYFFGGLACLGVGAGVYISMVNVAPMPVRMVVPTNTGIQKQINTVVGLLGNKLHQADLPGGIKNPASTININEKVSTVLFMGDIMLGRDVAGYMTKKGIDYPFLKIKDAISAASFAVANLEGPITKLNNTPDNDMRFHFDPSVASVLAATGFDAFSLANNHGLDQGAPGQADTKANLDAVGIKYFGDVVTDNGPALRFETNGKKISVIGFQNVYRKIDSVAAGKVIAAEKLVSDIVIVCPHWGDEYEHMQNATQTDLAHALIDAGADLVIGSHPHVIEGAEIYKNKPIFYSLGNLVFDQYFSIDTQQGLALRLSLGSAGLTAVELLPYQIPQSQPTLVDGDAKAKMLQNIASLSTPELKEGILSGSIRF